MPFSRACATGLRTKLACRTPGSAMSSTKRPRPRSNVASSTRSEGRARGACVELLIGRRPRSRGGSQSLHLLHDRVPFGEFLAQVAVAAFRPVSEHRLEAGVDELLQEHL